MDRIQRLQFSDRKSMIKNELKNAIEKNELYILYQPQINTLSNEITGIEALLRWDNSKLGNVSPVEFIPIAEDLDYIVEIGNWVMDKALRQACAWRKKGCKFNTISINVSPIQINKENFKKNLLSIINKYNIPRNFLEIEITEGTIIDINKEKIDMLTEIMNSGISIALDDFGTGYSSLSYLINIPVNTLKIDKIFIGNINSDKSKILIEGIVSLSKSLKYKIIAEGVETKEQLDLLTSIGCNIIQGFYFSEPLSESEMENLLKINGGLNNI